MLNVPYASTSESFAVCCRKASTGGTRKVDRPRRNNPRQRLRLAAAPGCPRLLASGRPAPNQVGGALLVRKPVRTARAPIGGDDQRHSAGGGQVVQDRGHRVAGDL